MFRFGLKNLRRLKEVEPVELRRITLLVGRNSSGKSTFLSRLAVVAAIINDAHIRPHLLVWHSVDFGSFQNAISDNDLKKVMSFSFGFDDVEVEPPYWSYSFANEGVRKYRDVQFEVRITNDDREGVVVQSMVVSYDGERHRFAVNASPHGHVSSLTLRWSRALS